MSSITGASLRRIKDVKKTGGSEGEDKKEHREPDCGGDAGCRYDTGKRLR